MSQQLHDLLERAAGVPPTTEEMVDRDLRRGRRALRRHRVATTAVPVVAITAVSAFGITVAQPDPAGSSLEEAEDGVALAPYLGTSPSGYEVEQLPEGWEIQEANPTYLMIGEEGSTIDEETTFSGKLVVRLRSASESGTPRGEQVAVGDGVGYLHLSDFADVLTFEVEGRQVEVAVPPSLGWDATTIADFALGVEVTSDAVPAQG